MVKADDSRRWYANYIGETFEVEGHNGKRWFTNDTLMHPDGTPFIGIVTQGDITAGDIKILHSRPNVSQAVIDGFAAIVDAQDRKGMAKYGKDIDSASDSDHDWKTEALEEAADYAKYLVKEIRRLEAENVRLRGELNETKSPAATD